MSPRVTTHDRRRRKKLDHRNIPPNAKSLSINEYIMRYSCLFLLFLMPLLCYSISNYEDYDPWKDVGIPDQTGSFAWRNIDETWLQDILNSPGWKQIVRYSYFRLGEKLFIPYREFENYGEAPHYERDYGTYPCIDGSTVAAAMVIEFARQHLDLPADELEEFVTLSTTHNAYINLIEKYDKWIPHGQSVKGYPVLYEEKHPVDLVIATEPSVEELQLARENGVELVIKPVCHDAFVFITHADNPVDTLTLEQVRGIYSGAILNWSEVGGPDHEIVAYQREANSGSQTAMEQMVMGGVPLQSAPMTKTIWGMGELVDAVAEYSNDLYSIGYTYRYYLDNLYRNDSIKVLRINGVAPDNGNIYSGVYPFSTYYYGVSRAGEENGTGGLFLDWMLSAEGQRCIEQAGYIPLVNN